MPEKELNELREAAETFLKYIEDEDSEVYDGWGVIEVAYDIEPVVRAWYEANKPQTGNTTIERAKTARGIYKKAKAKKKKRTT